jgi:hypothetical protein
MHYVSSFIEQTHFILQIDRFSKIQLAKCSFRFSFPGPVHFICFSNIVLIL